MTVGAGSLGTLLRSSFLLFRCSDRNSLNWQVALLLLHLADRGTQLVQLLDGILVAPAVGVCHRSQFHCDRPGLAAELDCTEQVFNVIEQADIELFMLISLLLLALILLGGQTFEFLGDPCYFALDHLV